MEYVKNCFTCEFGFNNIDYDCENKLVEGADSFIIICAGSNTFYGKEVDFNFSCEYWSKSFKEFMRICKKIDYDVFYKSGLDLINK